jgi:hypothetical protein
MRFKAPKYFPTDAARLALCNYDNPQPHKLQPYETRVYLWR